MATSVPDRDYIEANGLHSAPNEIASEYEVHDFLYSLVRILKPENVLETGCYNGFASAALGIGLASNGKGQLMTCDTDPECCAVAKIKTGMYPVYVHCMTGLSAAYMFKDIDLAFLDSSGDRVAECAALNLSPKGVVVLHDSKREEYKPIWTMRQWASIWEIDTPRGLTVFAL